MFPPFSIARWIWSHEPGDARFAVRRFRGGFDLPSGETVTCHVSADSRYVLYLDGVRVGHGPARSDLRHYVYETYEFSLTAGHHVFAAIVVAYHGDSAPLAEMHDRGAFLLEAQDANSNAVCATGNVGSWAVQVDQAIRPLTVRPLPAYYSVGAQEDVMGSLVPHGWEQLDFDATGWEPVCVIKNAMPRGTPNDMADPSGRWRLIPRDIPSMRMEVQAFTEAPIFPITIPANAEQSFLLAPDAYVNTFPRLTVSGGAGSVITLIYAEAMTKKGVKGIRDDREGTDVIGMCDIYRPGGTTETYMPLHWRAFRFVKLTVKTAAAPLMVEAFNYVLTGYPWDYNAAFSVAGGPLELPEILEVDFRTIQRCTDEIFMDCPYYAQQQYAGDTRIQALFTYVTTGDTRLGARAVRLFDWSRTADGLTQGRYPTAMEQVISPFSLFWVMMIEDLSRYAPSERETVTHALPGARGVLEWFERHLDETTGIISGLLPWWSFVDWAPGMPDGVSAPAAQGLASATINLQFLAAIQSYVRTLEAVGDVESASVWKRRAASLPSAIHAAFWDGECLREGPDDSFQSTQHAQAWGILTDTLTPDEQQRVANRLHDDPALIPATYYHRFYVVEALAKIDRLEHLWTRWLTPWQEALKLNLTTWPEKPEPSRSDCHAWSAWPTYCFLTHVLGVTPATSGFTEYKITPKRVAGWDQVSGTVVLPNRRLHVDVNWSASETPAITTREEPR